MAKKIIISKGLLSVIFLLLFPLISAIECGSQDCPLSTNITISVVSSDLINPNLTIFYPTDDLSKAGASNIPLNFLASDTNLDTCWYNIRKSDGSLETSNTSISCLANNSFSVSIYDTFSLTFYVNDTANNLNSSSVNFTITQPSSSSPPDEGTGGGSSYTQPTGLGTQEVTENDTEEYKMNKEICRMTYDHLLDYGNESYNINLLIGKLEAKGLYETKLILKYWYIDRFQETCSKHILRTEQPELLCNEIYWLVTNKGWDYDDYEIFNITKRLESKIDIDENIVREYANNYEELCNNDGVDIRELPTNDFDKAITKTFIIVVSIIILMVLVLIFHKKREIYVK